MTVMRTHRYTALKSLPHLSRAMRKPTAQHQQIMEQLLRASHVREGVRARLDERRPTCMCWS